MVSQYVKKVKKDPDLLDQLVAQRGQKERRKESICEYICDLNNKGSVISSTRSLQSKLKEEKDMELKRNYLAQILKENVGMRYKKIKPITVNTNSEKNLVLRQQFAQNLIKLLQSGKRVLNVDQTWIGATDFRRMKWMPKDSRNSIPMVSVVPRITMFAGLDTEGELYLSLLQSNSNNKVMEIYLR